jgi:CDP-diacylglycerol--serine O-phosphatidyltransferase
MQELLFVIATTLALSGWLAHLGVVVLKNVSVKEFIKEHPLLQPNSICYVRVGIVVLAMLFYSIGWQYLGIASYLLGVFLDAVDGMVARACGLVSAIGERLDPLCDKISYLIPMVYFCAIGMLPVVTLVAFIIIELSGQYIVRSILASLGWSVASNNFGKIKAVLAFSLIPYLFILQHNPGLSDISENLMIICLGLSICSAVFKLIPNKFYADILSVLNLICGICGIGLISQAQFLGATLAVMLGQVFDLFDGRMAIKHGGTKFGPWLDDAADFVSFGICPMYLILNIANDNLILKSAAVMYAVSIAYRLLRFVLVDRKRVDNNPALFFGLPSPAGAFCVFGVCLSGLSPIISSIIVALVSLLSITEYKFVHFGRGIICEIPKVMLIVLGSGMFVVLAYFFKINSSIGVGYSLLIGMIIYFVLSEISKRKIPNLSLDKICKG